MNLSFGVPTSATSRVNIFRQRGSTSIVIRFILGNIPALDELGLPNILGELIMEKRGLILIVGATGSGKSTTIASMLDHRNANRSGHILTVEDPIEFLFKHKKSIVNQREIGMDTQDWQSALKNAMRQAPDCILIGEIRDKETMQAAIAYSQTGHLCLATLHANNSYHALNRIISFFPAENRPALFLDLSVALRAIISQRLVKKPDGQRISDQRNHAQHPPHQRTDRARRSAGHQGRHGTDPGPGSRKLSSRTCSASTAPASSSPRRGPGQCRLADQPVVADQQLGIRQQQRQGRQEIRHGA